MLSLITVLFGIFLIYQIIDYLKPKYVEGYQMIMPIKYTFMTQPFFTNTVKKNTYYRNAKFNIDIDGLSMESTTKTNY
jgi:hypothetical protein